MPTELTSAQRRIYQAAIKLFGERGVTQVTVRELAESAGVARGTIYNNIESLDTLFDDVAGHLTREMNARVVAAAGAIDDPARRLALGVRLYLERAHEDPVWGQFLCAFALGNRVLQEIWQGAPARDLQQGIDQGRYLLRPEQLPSALAMLGSSMVGAITLVRRGLRTWRDAGVDLIELFLQAIGMPKVEAATLAREAMAG